MALTPAPRLFFFEVNTGSQSRGFLPNTYVDVSEVLEKKKAALAAHVSQDGLGVWRQHHEPIAIWRGREAGVSWAEAFVHLTRDSQRSKLPGI
jgi:LmbE family N-acetylglucosaminyl deacetylase